MIEGGDKGSSEELRELAVDVGRVGREVDESSGILKAGWDGPGVEGVVVEVDGLEGEEAGEEVWRGGYREEVAMEEGLEGGEPDKGGEGTGELVLIDLYQEEAGEVPNSNGKVPVSL